MSQIYALKRQGVCTVRTVHMSGRVVLLTTHLSPLCSCVGRMDPPTDISSLTVEASPSILPTQEQRGER